MPAVESDDVPYDRYEPIGGYADQALGANSLCEEVKRKGVESLEPTGIDFPSWRPGVK
jgi:hypothetical protein